MSVIDEAASMGIREVEMVEVNGDEIAMEVLRLRDPKSKGPFGENVKQKLCFFNYTVLIPIQNIQNCRVFEK